MDVTKNITNQKKHNISFKAVKTVFYNDYARLIHDPEHSSTEDRFIIMDPGSSLKLLIVVHAYREQDEIIRIISARKAAKNESKYYSSG